MGVDLEPCQSLDSRGRLAFLCRDLCCMPLDPGHPSGFVVGVPLGRELLQAWSGGCWACHKLGSKMLSGPLSVGPPPKPARLMLRFRWGKDSRALGFPDQVDETASFGDKPRDCAGIAWRRSGT